MLTVISLDKKDSSKWEDAIKYFKNRDIYYDRSYFLALEQYTESKILLFSYTNKDAKLCYVMQINDIAKDRHFRDVLQENKYFDMETPYGYGGLLAENYTSEDARCFQKEINDFCHKNGIISQFIRFNPITNNHIFSRDISEVSRMKSTIKIRLESEEQIIFDMDSKNRNMVRKAEKNGIKINRATNQEICVIQDEFERLYKLTMDRNNADNFYYFDQDYFNNFFANMKDKYEIFYAEYNKKIIAAAIIMKSNRFIHYYLSAADRTFMSLAPNNILLYKIALWGLENGYDTFHLGGGISDNDSLFSFKKSFNRKDVLDFYIGRNIFDKEAFDFLVSLRKQNDNSFDLSTKYMIKYRQE